jgi:hypothetical protein
MKDEGRRVPEIDVPSACGRGRSAFAFGKKAPVSIATCSRRKPSQQPSTTFTTTQCSGNCAVEPWIGTGRAHDTILEIHRDSNIPIYRSFTACPLERSNAERSLNPTSTGRASGTHGLLSSREGCKRMERRSTAPNRQWHPCECRRESTGGWNLARRSRLFADAVWRAYPANFADFQPSRKLPEGRLMQAGPRGNGTALLAANEAVSQRRTQFRRAS